MTTLVSHTAYRGYCIRCKQFSNNFRCIQTKQGTIASDNHDSAPSALGIRLLGMVLCVMMIAIWQWEAVLELSAIVLSLVIGWHDGCKCANNEVESKNSEEKEMLTPNNHDYRT